MPDDIEDLREETRLFIISVEEIILKFQNTMPPDTKTSLDNMKKAAKDVLASLSNIGP